jgi:hypothetical protein
VSLVATAAFWDKAIAMEDKITGMKVNIRQTPSLKGLVLTQLNEGDNVRVLERSNGWYRILFKQRWKPRIGWVYGFYVECLNKKLSYPFIELRGVFEWGEDLKETSHPIYLQSNPKVESLRKRNHSKMRKGDKAILIKTATRTTVLEEMWPPGKVKILFGKLGLADGSVGWFPLGKQFGHNFVFAQSYYTVIFSQVLRRQQSLPPLRIATAYKLHDKFIKDYNAQAAKQIEDMEREILAILSNSNYDSTKKERELKKIWEEDPKIAALASAIIGGKDLDEYLYQNLGLEITKQFSEIERNILINSVLSLSTGNLSGTVSSLVVAYLVERAAATTIQSLSGSPGSYGSSKREYIEWMKEAPLGSPPVMPENLSLEEKEEAWKKHKEWESRRPGSSPSYYRSGSSSSGSSESEFGSSASGSSSRSSDNGSDKPSTPLDPVLKGIEEAIEKW